LSSVVERVGRYSNRQVMVERDAAALRLSGVFDAGDLNTFVDAVQRALPVTSETDEDGVVHLRRRSGERQR
jgi:transmembrane sensor